MSGLSQVEQLLARECGSETAVIVKKHASHKILDPSEVKKLRPYKFPEYLKRMGLRLFYPIVLYYYGMKKSHSEFSYGAYQVLHISTKTVEQRGLTEHLGLWDSSSEIPPDEDKLRELLGRALIEEARERGIFDEVDKMLQSNIEF